MGDEKKKLGAEISNLLYQDVIHSTLERQPHDIHCPAHHRSEVLIVCGRNVRVHRFGDAQH